MIAADTHWYCKCVVMIDIFLRLYNRGTREGVEIVEGLDHVTEMLSVCKLTSSECRIASSWITIFLAA